jgi:hypothetical protein
MASNKTPNLGLDVWAEMDYFKRAELNDNFTKLDTKAKENSDKIIDLTQNVTAQLAEIATSVESFSGTDTQKLQAALNTGKSIVLGKNKTYSITAPLNISNSNQRIIGNGATINNSANNDKVFNIVGSSSNYLKNISIEDLNINVGTITANSVNGQIHCVRVDRIKIERCNISATSATSSAIYFSFVTNSTVKNCEFNEFKKGVFATDSYNSELNANRFVCNRTPANYSDGFYAISYDDYATQTRTIKGVNILNNYFSGYSLSISLRYGIKCTIQGNLITNTAFGMTIDRSSFVSVNTNIIEFSSTTASPQLYIELVCSNDCLISGNHLRCDTQIGQGIGIYGDTTVPNYNAPINNTISNNNINNLSQGIVVKLNSQNTLVNGNNVINCINGVQIYAQNINGTTVSNNTLKTCTNYGLYYEDATSGFAASIIHIKNNYIRNCNNSLFGNTSNLGQSTCYIIGNTVVHTTDGRAIYGVFSNCYLIENTVQHIGIGYYGIGIINNANITGKSVYLLRNTILNSLFKIWQGDTFYTYKNVLGNGATYSKNATPVVNELTEITY